MRAAVFTGVGEPLSIQERPDPKPAPGQVVVRVGRCGICASDLEMTRECVLTATPGSVLGHEFAGEVVELGSGVDCLRVGDRVAVLPAASACGRCAGCRRGQPKECTGASGHGVRQPGGYAEYTLAKAWTSFHLPTSLSLEDGALVEPLAVALHGVDMAGLQPGDRVLVLGAGPIGLATVFWARRRGARPVVAVATSPRRAGLVDAVGGSGFVTRGDDFPAAAEEALAGAPDVVFDCVGRHGTLADAIAAVRRRGTIVVLGACMHPDSFVPVWALLKEVTVRFALTYGMEDYDLTIRTLASGAVEPRAMVTDTISLDELPTTLEQLRNPGSDCKVMVDPWTNAATTGERTNPAGVAVVGD
jgi:(R,R)-butanediol dehydrogenase/meso-butanediol dehydrogenase/diacetyl reductase